jgi:hypothetical protein
LKIQLDRSKRRRQFGCAAYRDEKAPLPRAARGKAKHSPAFGHICAGLNPGLVGKVRNEEAQVGSAVIATDGAGWNEVYSPGWPQQPDASFNRKSTCTASRLILRSPELL